MTEETRPEKEGFASRWSRLKRQQTASPEEPKPPAASDGPPPGGTSEESRELPPVEALPDPDGMEPTADFSVFMRENVPEMLRRKALRRLWRSNPIIGAVDMLDDYCEDFTDAATVIPTLRTVYKLGKGMLGPGEEQAPAGPGEEPVADETAAVAEGRAESAEEVAREPDGDDEEAVAEGAPERPGGLLARTGGKG